eukprot:1302918-Rhodomonas_salina.2
MDVSPSVIIIIITVIMINTSTIAIGIVISTMRTSPSSLTPKPPTPSDDHQCGWTRESGPASEPSMTSAVHPSSQ